MGQDKTKTLQAGLQGFRFFSANPRSLGSSVPTEKSVVSFPATAQRVTGGKNSVKKRKKITNERF